MVSLGALVWLSVRRVESNEAKRPFDQREELRAWEQAEDGRFIMRSAFWVELWFGVSGHAGKSRLCASGHRNRGMARAR